MNDIVLYSSEPNPADIVLRPVSAGGSIVAESETIISCIASFIGISIPRERAKQISNSGAIHIPDETDKFRQDQDDFEIIQVLANWLGRL